jgi:hypothetical protein
MQIQLRCDNIKKAAITIKASAAEPFFGVGADRIWFYNLDADDHDEITVTRGGNFQYRHKIYDYCTIMEDKHSRERKHSKGAL